MCDNAAKLIPLSLCTFRPCKVLRAQHCDGACDVLSAGQQSSEVSSCCQLDEFSDRNVSCGH